ncbi:MAG: hypothetical protein ABW096_14200 [Candidatus Thiodiazotropha sp.]
MHRRQPGRRWHSHKPHREESTIQSNKGINDATASANGKADYRSFYYDGAPESEDIRIDPDETALLVIDTRNTYLETPQDPLQAEHWQPFLERMRH